MCDSKSKGASHVRERNLENFLLVWVDGNINQSKPDCQNTLTQLRTIVNNVNLCTTADQCIQFLQNTKNEKAFLIISGSLGQTLVPDIHSLSQVDAIYVFCGNKTRNEQWAKDYSKVRGVHTNIEMICQELPIVVKQCNQDSVGVSVVAADEKASDGNLDRLEPCFMYTQIFKEILLEMDHDDKSKADLIAYCRTFYHRNEAELKTIDEFEKNYRPQLAIWWYTRECFTYQMLNRALRLLEADTIIKMGFFIRDLHQEIQKLYETQINTYPEKRFIVYRGQGLLTEDFDKLKKSKGGLLSFSSFLSTSKIRKESLRFATKALTKTNTVGIIFKMSIDTSISSAPFAAIENMAEYGTEEEILFSMHTIFRIGEVNRIDDTKLLYEVDLQLTADDDQQLTDLIRLLRKETAGSTGWSRLGKLLLRLSQFDRAEEVYKTLLEQTSDEKIRSVYYSQLGTIKTNKAEYDKALEYYEKGLAIEQKIYPSNHPSLASSYSDIGGVYYHKREYTKALVYYEKDLEISLKTRSSDDRYFAAVYNNIGLVCDQIGEYSKALMVYEKVLKIKQKILPSNHPSLATTYGNIAGVYANMQDYSRALVFYEKDLEICKKTLPPDHHLLGISYSNIGGVYHAMKEYAKALPYLERALTINQRVLPADHPVMRSVQNRIAIAKEKLKSKT